MTERTCKIVRFCFDDSNEHNREVITTGLTPQQAAEICSNPSSTGNDPEFGGSWFYGWYWEDDHHEGAIMEVRES